MASAEQSGEPLRDFGSPATWGDVEQVRLSLEARIDTQVAGVQTQMTTMQSRMEAQMTTMQSRMEAQMTTMESRMEAQMARLEARLIRWSAGLAAAAGIAVIGVLVGVVQAVD